MGKHVVHDTHEHGWLSLQQIIKYSSNIGAIKFSAITGPEYLFRTFRNFGFGSKTGIDCPGETNGSLSPFKRWTKVDAGTISFGQGVSVSALQLIVATSAVANKGVLMKPYVVQAITDHNGRLIKSFGPKRVRRVISEKTAGTLSRIMQTVITEGGTGVNAALEGYSVCGKTGTAQINKKEGNLELAWFIGFAPVEDPQIAIVALVEGQNLNENFGGGAHAAPMARYVLQAYFDKHPEFKAQPKAVHAQL